MKLAKRLMGRRVGTDPYFSNVVHLFQVPSSAIDGTSDYENVVGSTLVKCGTPVVSAVGGEKSVSFNGSSQCLLFDVGDAHVSPVADTARNGVADSTFEFVFTVSSLSGYVWLYSIGFPGSGWGGCGQTAANLGGLSLFVNNGKVGINAGNLYVHGKTGYVGMQTIGTINIGRNEVVVRFINNVMYVHINGVLQTLSVTDGAFPKTDFSNLQAYVPRQVNIASYGLYNCSRDTTLSCSATFRSSGNLIACRITKGVVRDVLYPIPLPFPTT